MTHVALAAAALAVALAASLQGATAGPTREPVAPTSILPENVGIGVPTTDAVVLTFDEPVDRRSVEEAVVLRPATAWRAAWSQDGTVLRLMPERRWRTDARYLISIGSGARSADGDAIATTPPLSFTTETAPTITDFLLYYVEETTADRVRAAVEQEMASVTDRSAAGEPPTDAVVDVSSRTRITVGFSTAMQQTDVEQRFTINPAISGDLSWEGNSLVFEPLERLEPGARYTVSVIGAHDARGNRIAGDTSFSFTTRAGAQVVRISPKGGARDVTDTQAQLWFSQPMNTTATRSALKVEDMTAGSTVSGKASWNDAGTQLTFVFNDPLAPGHEYLMTLGKGARDADQNRVSGAWGFTTKAPEPAPQAAPAPAQPGQTRTTPPPSRPSGPPPPSDIQEFALWQINQSRARYGFAPLRLDAGITAVATAHAWDMINNNYFSHTGLDGSSTKTRLRRGGVSFSWSGENICYYSGIGVRATLDWCHGVFMAEPYPGYANHIGNILSPNFTRVGIGIAQSGGRIKIVWDFAG